MILMMTMTMTMTMITICTSKRQRTRENREVQISSRRNGKVVEAEESDGCASWD